MTRNPWDRLLGNDLRSASAEQVKAVRAQLLRKWAQHPLYWLLGIDTTTTTAEGLGPSMEGTEFPQGRPLIWTMDERDKDHPVKPFPRDWEYLRFFVRDLHLYDKILIDKSRQVFATHTVLLYMDWFCRFVPGRLGVVSKRIKEEAEDLLNDKIRRMHVMLPQWVQEELPLKPKPLGRLPYPRSHSAIRAAAENAAVGIARGNTASILFIDEAAYQDMCGQIISAALPMASKLFVCSTANIGPPGARVMKSYLEEKVKELAA